MPEHFRDEFLMIKRYTTLWLLLLHARLQHAVWVILLLDGGDGRSRSAVALRIKLTAFRMHPARCCKRGCSCSGLRPYMLCNEMIAVSQLVRSLSRVMHALIIFYSPSWRPLLDAVQ